MGEQYPDLNVCNRTMFEGKAMGNQAKISDLARVHDDVIGIEEGVNRNLRLINRKVTAMGTRVQEIETDTNTGFSTTSTRIDTLGQVVTELDARFSTFKSELEVRENLEYDELNRSNVIPGNPPGNRPKPPATTVGIIPQPISPVLPTHSGNNATRNCETLNSVSEAQTNQNPDGNLNALSEMGTSGPQPGLFVGEIASAFDEWEIKFRDYTDVFGANWTEPEKLNRLKLHLGSQTQNIFENLLPNERDTLANALKNIRSKLDSPHFRELAYRKLAACYQKDGESVSEFIKRLVPLVNTTSVQIPPEAREEMLCRCLMEKVRPEFQRSLQLVGPLIGRKDFEKLTAYIQELEISIERDIRSESLGIHAINENASQIPPGKFNTWGPSNSNNTPLGQRRFEADNRPWQDRTNDRNTGNNRRFNQPKRGWGPQNDRRWNNKPYCHYCKRTGHDQYNCRERRQEFPEPSNRNNQSRWNSSRTENSNRDNFMNETRQLKGMIEDLAVQVHEMKMSKNYASASQPNVRALQLIEMDENKSNEKPKTDQGPKRISSWESKEKGLTNSCKAFTTIMLISLLLFTPAVSSSIIANKPMICQTQRQAMIWELPETIGCPTIDLRVDHSPIPQMRQLFIPNSIEFSTKAWACRKIRKNVRKYTTISGIPVEERREPESINVSVDECRQMIKHKSCSFGILKSHSNLWQTENKIDLTPRFWFVGSFAWKNVSSENCFLFESRVDSHFGAKSIVTPLGETEHCPYDKGQCILDDRTVLIWEVDKERKCNFMSIGNKNGRMMDKIWLSDDGELGLSFGNQTDILDCGRTITVSDQGFGSLIVYTSESHRKKRSWKENKKQVTERVVTSSQLASQLTYLDTEITQTMSFAFAQSLRVFCEFIGDNRRWVEASFFSNPTDLARFIFSNPYVVAKRAARSLLKLWPCVPLDHNDYEFRPTKLENQCFEFIPITLKTQSNVYLAFLDPTTMIVSSSSRKGPCEELRKTVIQIDNHTLEVDQILGKITSVVPNKLTSHEIKFKMTDLIPHIEPHAFHKLVLLNLTDVKEHAFVSNMVKLSQITYQIQESDTKIFATVSEEWEEVESHMVKAIIGDYKQIWLIIVSILVAILATDLAIRLAFGLGEIYAGNGRLGKILFGPNIQKPRQRVVELRHLKRSANQIEEIEWASALDCFSKPTLSIKLGKASAIKSAYGIDEPKEPSCSNGMGSSASAKSENEEFSVRSKEKSKVIVEYIICQVFEEHVTGGRLDTLTNEDWPHFLEISNREAEECDEFFRDLQIGDTVSVLNFEWKKEYEHLSWKGSEGSHGNSWWRVEKIITQASALNPIFIKYKPWSQFPGVVMGIGNRVRRRIAEKAWAIISSPGLQFPSHCSQRQLIGLHFGALEEGQVVTVSVASIPEECLIDSSHILPPHSNFRVGTEKQLEKGNGALACVGPRAPSKLEKIKRIREAEKAYLTK